MDDRVSDCLSDRPLLTEYSVLSHPILKNLSSDEVLSSKKPFPDGILELAIYPHGTARPSAAWVERWRPRRG